ncbi:hypothetical protein B0H19DRAFT_1202123 [Mycena capillaripes]|nr:hypothetical protein B0H19DRAFT_1202123 [Mycena capillaripes]
MTSRRTSSRLEPVLQAPPPPSASTHSLRTLVPASHRYSITDPAAYADSLGSLLAG